MTANDDRQPKQKASARARTLKPEPALAMAYFPKEAVWSFIPSLTEVTLLERLASGNDPVPLAAVLPEAEAADRTQILEALERLANARMVRCVQTGGSESLTLTEEGSKYYQELLEAEKANEKACRERLGALPLEDANRAFELMEAWMREQPSDVLVELLIGSKTFTLPDDPELAKVLRHVPKGRPRKDKPASPLYLRAIGHLLAALTLEVYNEYSRVAGMPTRVILDTNVITRLLTSDARTPVHETLHNVVTSKNPVEFQLAKITLAELDAFFQRTQHACIAWQLHGTADVVRRLSELFRGIQKEKSTSGKAGDVEELIMEAMSQEGDADARWEETVRTIGAFGVEFFSNFEAPPTFDEFRDWKKRQLLGEIPLGQLGCTWKPTLVNTRPDVDQVKVEELLDKLTHSDSWSRRPDVVERHDIELLLYAEERNRRDHSHKHVIWTHHGSLKKMATMIGVDPECVIYGPRLNRYACLAPQALREYVRYLFLRTGHEIAGNTNDLRRLLRAQNLADRPVTTFPEFLLRFFSSRILAATSSSQVVDDEEAVAEAGEPGGRQDLINALLPADLLEGSEQSLERRGWHDLSMDWNSSPGGHGVGPLRVFWLEDSDTSDRRSMLWHMSPHTVTHVDLPWALDRLPALPNARKRGRACLPDTPEAQSCMQTLLAPRCVRTIFVDFTDFGDDPDLCSQTMPHLSGDELVRLVNKLRISPDVLEERLPKEEDLSNTLLVLHTGWAARFGTGLRELSSRAWEAAHPWMVHPWLDYAGVCELIARNVAGVGIDALMADCPMYIAANTFPRRPSVAKAASHFFPDPSAEDSPPERVDDVAEAAASALPSLQPVHVGMLERFRVLAEGLSIPDAVCEWYHRPERFFASHVFLTALSSHFLPDAAIVKLLVKRPHA